MGMQGGLVWPRELGHASLGKSLEPQDRKEGEGGRQLCYVQRTESRASFMGM